MVIIKALTKQYGARAVLRDISLHLPAGEIVGLLGVNGAGKSTLMNIISGYTGFNSGEVWVNGAEILRDPIRVKRSIGYLGEHPALYSDMTVDEQLNFVFDLRKLQGDRAQQLRDVCEKAGIPHVRGRRIQNLSKGYRQRVGLAQALLGNPPLLLLDEPTVGLDPRQMVEMRSLIQNLRGGHTVIISSHLLNEIDAICDRVIILHEGRIAADGDPRLLRGRAVENRIFHFSVSGADDGRVIPAVLAIPAVTRCGRLPDAEPGASTFEAETKDRADIRAALLQAMGEQQRAILLLSEAAPTLEEVFVRLTGTAAQE